MIKSKLLMLVGLVTLICFTLSAGSLALFSSEAISSENNLTTGTLDINGLKDCEIKLDSLMPGETPKEVTLTVTNSGTVPGYLSGISASIEESDNKYVANAIKAFCYDVKGNVLFEGSLLALDGNVVPLNNEIKLEPEQTINLKCTFQLDERAGNWYEGINTNFSLTVFAGQNPGQQVGKTVRLAGADKVQSALDQAKPGDVVLIPSGTYNEQFRITAPGVTVKAKDVVFDTAVKGFVLNAGDTADDNAINAIQGFTINNASGAGVHIVKGKECNITDNIISAKGAVKLNRLCKEVVTRNDLSGSKDAAGKDVSSSKSVQIEGVEAGDIFEYNLGADIILEEDILHLPVSAGAN